MTSDQNYRPTLVVIEDDDAVRRSMQLLLHWNGCDVRAYGSARAAIADPAARGATALIVDYRLLDGDGIGVLRAFRRAGWSGRAILITAFPSSTLTEAAHANGFDAVIEKPLHQQQLIQAVARPAG